MKSNPVVHFEMPYENHERLMNFYSNAFGWQMNKLGNEMGDYVLAGTAEMDENQIPKTPGTINGGFFPKTPDASTIPSVVISVDDIQEAMNRIKNSGGKILAEPMPIPGIGQFISFSDTEGNVVGALQPVPMKQ